MIYEMNVDSEKIIQILKHYVPARWYDLNNWNKILSRVEKVDDLYLFRCSFLDLYFDKNMVIQEYGFVKILQGKVYYFIQDDDKYDKFNYELILGEYLK